MKNFVICMVMTVFMSGLSFAGDCANGRCGLARRFSQPVVSSQRVVRSQDHARPNVRMSNPRGLRTVR